MFIYITFYNVGRSRPYRSSSTPFSAKSELVGGLHEADVGALLELLDHETRPRLIELMGSDFDFAALTEVGETVREDILEELRGRGFSPRACATWRATTRSPF